MLCWRRSINASLMDVMLPGSRKLMVTVSGAPTIPGQAPTVKYSRCRVYPATALTPVAIAGLTRANPCVVTWTTHGLATGDIVFIDGITQARLERVLNKRRFQITKINDNSFSLKLLDRTDTPANLNTSGYAADYVPATDPGVIHAARFGFELLNSYGPVLDHCYVDGGYCHRLHFLLSSWLQWVNRRLCWAKN